MNLRSSKGELLYDPEIEKTARDNRKKTKESMADHTFTQRQLEERLALERQAMERAMAEQLETERARWEAAQAADALRKVEEERGKSCLESITPQFRERWGVVYGGIGQNQTFKIDASVLASLRDIQFNGLKDECPIDHLRNFLDVASCYQVANVSSDQMRLRLFPQSLAGKAKAWYWNDIPENSVHTWEELQNVFMKKFFPPSRTQLFIREISNFQQDDDESLAAAFERFKELIRKCPHHGQTEAALVRWFAQGLYFTYQNQLDMMSAGNFLEQPPAACWELIEKIVNNSTRAHQRGVHRGSEKAKGVLALSTRDHAEARVSAEIYTDHIARLDREIEALKKKESVKALECVTCGGAHSYENCTEVKVAYVHGQYNNRNVNPQNWPNSNNRNWTHPQPQHAQPSSSSWQPQPPFPNQSSKPSLEDAVAQLTQVQAQMAQAQLSTDSKITLQGKAIDVLTESMKDMKAQMGHVVEVVNMSKREPGNFPSNTINPRNEHLKAITLRSGREIQGAEVGKQTDQSASARKEDSERSLEELESGVDAEGFASARSKVSERSHHQKAEVETFVREYPPPPFPQRLKKNKDEQGLAKFVDHLRKLSITIPFTEALTKIPSYAKFMKELLMNKSKVKLENVMLTEVVKTMMHKTLPPKLKDGGAFHIPCVIGTKFFGKALCDLGASINLMPLSIFKRLGLGELKRTMMKLQLADQSYISPYGVVEDVIIKVDNMMIPTDFVVCDVEADKEVPLILGRPFLRTGRALIDVHGGKLTLRVNGKEVKYDVHKAMKYPDDGGEHDDEECFSINAVDALVKAIRHKEELEDDDYGFDYEQFYEDGMEVDEEDKLPVKELKPLNSKPVTNTLDDDCLDLSDSFPVIFSTDLKGVMEDDPLMDKKRKIGSSEKKEKPHLQKKKKKKGIFEMCERMQEEIKELNAKLQTYFPSPQRWKPNLKMDVDRKEVIK